VFLLLIPGGEIDIFAEYFLNDFEVFFQYGKKILVRLVAGGVLNLAVVSNGTIRF
jgi:hypothetical protein